MVEVSKQNSKPIDAAKMGSMTEHMPSGVLGELLPKNKLKVAQAEAKAQEITNQKQKAM